MKGLQAFGILALLGFAALIVVSMEGASCGNYCERHPQECERIEQEIEQRTAGPTGGGMSEEAEKAAWDDYWATKEAEVGGQYDDYEEPPTPFSEPEYEVPR